MNLRKKRAVLKIMAVMLLAVFISAGAITAGATEAQASYGSELRSIPSGAYRLNLNINGRDVLRGKVFNYRGVTYVPMFNFADWLGVFTYSYNKYSRTATLEGTNLEIIARAGDLYIEANDRYFYTSGEVLEINGEIYVPILPITKALNSHWSYNSDNSTFYIYSGDTRLLRRGAQFYREDEVFWLARIITAEAKGEPMKGKMAVGNVVLNRVRSSAYPNTIYGVIFDKRYGIQFSPVANGTIYQTPTADSIIAAKMCLEGYTLSDEIIYFVNPVKAPDSWISKNRPYAFSIGNHAFFE